MANDDRPSPTMSPAEIKKDLERRGIEHVKVGGFDIDGVLRGKYVSMDKFLSAMETGFGFCDVIFGWDLDDQLYQDSHNDKAVTGWHSGYPDTLARVDLSTYRILPWEPKTAAFLIDFFHANGQTHAACPRSLLKSILAKYEARGLRASVACEFEFWIFKEDAKSIREKGYRKLEPITPGMFGYSWLREGQNQELVHAILNEMKAFDIEIEGFHTETGPGVYEAAIKYDDALRAADKAALFKTACKQICTRFGVIPTFMAKWSADLPGSSGHLHQSIWNKEGKNVLFDDAAEHKLSSFARNYIAGMVELAPDLTAVYAPTVNAYKRYVPGVWAPLTASWGVDNRTTAIRVISGGASSTRIEYRQTAADINPYTAIASCLASGLYGVEKQLTPPAVASGDASGAHLRALPRSLSEATTLLENSKGARAVLGDRFVDHYVRTRRHEVAKFERAVTSWELERYFEII